MVLKIALLVVSLALLAVSVYFIVRVTTEMQIEKRGCLTGKTYNHTGKRQKHTDDSDH